jgi:hypothetical protein
MLLALNARQPFVMQRLLAVEQCMQCLVAACLQGHLSWLA